MNKKLNKDADIPNKPKRVGEGPLPYDGRPDDDEEITRKRDELYASLVEKSRGKRKYKTYGGE